MKSLIVALVLALALSVSAKNTTPDPKSKDSKQTVTTETKTTVTKDGKTKKVTRKITKTAKKECTDKSGCCSDEGSKSGECKDSK